MALQIIYGNIELSKVNGKPKLGCQLNPKMKLVVNKFDGNGLVYVHLNSRQKSLSVTLDEFQELVDIAPQIRQRLYLLDEGVS